MTKILVTGNAGSGKTTLAQQIASALGLSADGLDEIVWQSEWRPTPKARREELELELVRKPNWVIDGVSLTVQKHADMVVFLDFSRRISFLRCLRRNILYLFRSRPGLPEKCPEIKILPTLIKIIWRFPKHVRPKILALRNSHSVEQKFVHIKTSAEIYEFLHSIGKRHADRSRCCSRHSNVDR